MKFKNLRLKELKLKHILISLALVVGLIFFFIYIREIWAFLGVIWTVFKPVVYGLVIAYILNYPYKLFNDHAFKKMGTKHRWLLKIRKPLSIVLSYVIVFGLVVFLISFLIPELTSSVNTLVDNIPAYSQTLKNFIDKVADFIYTHFGYNLYDGETYTNLINFITGNSTADFIKNIMTNIVPSAFSTVLGIGTGLYNWIIGIIISIYLLASKERLLVQVKRVINAYTPPRFSLRFFKFAEICNVKCGKYIIGKLIDCFIIGIICFIGLSIFRFHYALLISVIVGVTNFIPFFGPIIGAIPCIFLLLIINPLEALFFLIFIVALQQFDGNILGPKILGETVGISGFWILVSVIVGGGLFGVPGMVLAVPVFAVIYTLLQDGVNRREAKKRSARKFENTAQNELPLSISDRTTVHSVKKEP